MDDLVTLLARYIKHLFPKKCIQTGYADLLKNLDGCGLIKKVLHHKSYSKQYKAISQQSIQTNCTYVSQKIMSQKKFLI